MFEGKLWEQRQKQDQNFQYGKVTTEHIESEKETNPKEQD